MGEQITPWSDRAVFSHYGRVFEVAAGGTLSVLSGENARGTCFIEGVLWHLAESRVRCMRVEREWIEDCQWGRPKRGRGCNEVGLFEERMRECILGRIIHLLWRGNWKKMRRGVFREKFPKLSYYE